MKIHKEGYGLLKVLFLLLVPVNILMLTLRPFNSFFINGFAALSVILFFFVIWFFRKPEREMPEPDDHLIFAPADGKLVTIEETNETEYFNDKRLKLSIFMSPLNAHVNLYPVSGVVTYCKYHPGKYIVAWHPKSSDKNECSTIVIKSENSTEILVRQIAGAVARRIVTYAKTGNPVTQCGEMGFIKFGSRVDLFLPLNSDINVDIGNKVYGKRTVVATLPA